MTFFKIAKDTLKPLYFKLPPSLRQPVGYKSMHRFYQNAQFWPDEKIRNWQLMKLKEIVNYAYQSVPGYYQLFKEANISPKDIISLHDIVKLPFTDKTLMRDNLDDFTSRKIKRNQMRKCTTGGSTGIPFGFFYDKMSSAVEYAFMYNAWETTGWKINDLGVILRGGYIGTSEKLFSQTEGKRLSLSSYYLTESTYPKYREFIQRSKATFLHAYPSSAFDLARLIINHDDIGKNSFKSIFLGSENLYAWQVETIKEAFPMAQIMAWYGHTERAIWAPWCEHEEKYHASPFYGYTEILGENNTEVKKGQKGELVGTSFWMKATPFIRYRTMDYATKGEESCKKCDRNFQLLDSIDGRLQEIVLSKSGRRISMTAINMHDDTFDEVSQFRFIQNTPGELEIFIVPKVNYSFESKRKILKNIQTKLGADFSLTIKVTQNLDRSSAGKFSFLQQNIKIEHSDRIKY